jgi:hypothetical protein
LNGIIFDVVQEAGHSTYHALRRWVILYEDGQTDEAYDHEVEVIDECR